MNGLTVVFSFRDVVDAQVALAKLESWDIECSLANEHVVGVFCGDKARYVARGRYSNGIRCR